MGKYPGMIHGKSEWLSDSEHSVFNFDKRVYIEIMGPHNLNIKDAITIEAWIKPKSIYSRNADTRIVMKGNYIWGISRDERLGKDSVHAYINHGNNVLTASVVLDEWQHVVLIYDINEKVMKLFINGEMRDKKFYDEPVISSNENLFIGGDGMQNFSGYIGKIKIYNKSLSNNEVLLSYKKGS